jgi:CBS domain-containing protein
MPNIQAILDRKGTHVYSVPEDATVLDAACLMNEHRIGGLVVTHGERVVGIFTERDVLNRVVAARRDPAGTSVKDVMSSPVACCTPQTSRAECLAVMRQRRLRHLPVVQDDRLLGIISIGDLLEAAEADQQATIRYLHDYLYGQWR